MKNKKLGKIWFSTLIIISTILSSCTSSIPYTGQLISYFFRHETLSLYANSAAFYQEIINEANKYGLIVTGTEEAEMVQRVSKRIQRSAEKWATVNGKSEYLQDYNWNYVLIINNAANAFCLPGGKIVVFTGILPIARNEDGLAAIIGHEVAHAILKHGQQSIDYERNSFKDSALASLDKASINPYSRNHEKEADLVGLSLMVIAGYNGNEAVSVWKRMSALGEIPEFYSTHPSSSRRADYLWQEIPTSQHIARKINSGTPARQFVEKTLSVGGGVGQDLIAYIDTNSFRWGANIFFDAKFIELNTTIFTRDSTNWTFELLTKYPRPLDYDTTWFPIVGVNYGDYGYGLWGINYGIGFDYNITDRLYFRGIVTGCQWLVEDSIWTIPVRISIGYAFY